jgi:hypothetical protein
MRIRSIATELSLVAILLVSAALAGLSLYVTGSTHDIFLSMQMDGMIPDGSGKPERGHGDAGQTGGRNPLPP